MFALAVERDIYDWLLLVAQGMIACGTLGAALYAAGAAKQSERSAGTALDSARAARESVEVARESLSVAHAMLELAKSERLQRVEQMKALLYACVRAMVAKGGSHFLFRDPEHADIYEMREVGAGAERGPGRRPLQYVARQDGSRFKACKSASPDEGMALKMIVTEGGWHFDPTQDDH
jgi:hypothetical protein